LKHFTWSVTIIFAIASDQPRLRLTKGTLSQKCFNKKKPLVMSREWFLFMGILGRTLLIDGTNHQMTQDLSQTSEQPEEQETEEQPDPIALLAERLGAIESALGIGGSKPNESNLLGRLGAIEEGLTKDQRERNLPPTISKSQAADPSFLRKAGIDLRDFTSGKVRIEG
jgi:hypothetical protein